MSKLSKIIQARFMDDAGTPHIVVAAVVTRLASGVTAAATSQPRPAPAYRLHRT